MRLVFLLGVLTDDDDLLTAADVINAQIFGLHTCRFVGD